MRTFANAFISGSCRHGDSRGGNRTRDLLSLGGEVPYPLGHRAILLIPQRPSEALRSKGMVSSPRLPFSHHLGKNAGCRKCLHLGILPSWRFARRESNSRPPLLRRGGALSIRPQGHPPHSTAAFRGPVKQRHGLMSTASILPSSRQKSGLSANAFISGHCRHGDTRGGTRTRNLLLRREAPYPLGHTSSC